MPYTSTEPVIKNIDTFPDVTGIDLKIGDVVCYGVKGNLEIAVVKNFKQQKAAYGQTTILTAILTTKTVAYDIHTRQFSNKPGTSKIYVNANICKIGNIDDEREWTPQVQEIIDYYRNSL